MTTCKWPTKPLSQVQVTVGETSMMAAPERAYFDAAAVNEAVMAERKAFADELAAEMTLDGFGCACEPRKQCGTCRARDVLAKALSPMLRRLRA